MNHRYARLVAVAAALSVAGTLTACGGGAPATTSSAGADVSVGAMKDYKAGEAFKATAPVTFPILYSDMNTYPIKKDWLLWQKITQLTNVTLDPTVVPFSDYAQKRSLLIGAGDAPMILPKTYPGQESAFVASGAILPVSDYVDLMPNYAKKVKDWGMQKEIDLLRQADGKYYVLPGMHQELWPDYTLVIRTDVFTKDGIKVPGTWDEFKTALKDLKTANPASPYPFSDRFLGGATLSASAPSFGTTMGSGLFVSSEPTRFDAKAGKFVFAAATPQYKTMLTYFHSLVAGGLMDPESFTQPDAQAVQKFTTGKSFVISANSQNIVDYRKAMDATLGAGNYAIKKITLPGGPAGDKIAGSRLENGVMINSQAKKSPNFVAMMQFVDWLYYSDAGQEFAKWGVKGTTYDKDAAGKRTLVPGVNYNGLNPAGTKDLRVDYGFSGGVFAYGGTTDLLQSMMSPEEITFQKAMKSKTPEVLAPPAPLSDAVREQATMLVTPLQDKVNQATLQFILGQRPLSQFDAFVTELKGNGMTTYMDLKNKAYTEYNAKNKTKS